MIKPGKQRWFEYHCWESPNSADADLWYHSHQRCTIGVCENPEFADIPQQERYEAACLLAYKVTFADGFVHTAMEDELYYHRSRFCRPDPPKLV